MLRYKIIIVEIIFHTLRYGRISPCVTAEQIWELLSPALYRHIQRQPYLALCAYAFKRLILAVKHKPVKHILVLFAVEHILSEYLHQRFIVKECRQQYIYIKALCTVRTPYIRL